MAKLVVATAPGYHNGARVPKGKEFLVPDKLKAKWFEPVKRARAAPADAPPPPKPPEDAPGTDNAPLA